MIKKIIIDSDIIDSIYRIKEDKLKEIFGKYKLYEITTQKVDDILDNFLNFDPPIISPLLINTIITRDFVKHFLELILIDSPGIQENLELIKKFKENIKYLITINGIKFYSFNYKDIYKNFPKGKQIGVIAQEVEHIPNAVIQKEDGKYVNYNVIKNFINK